ncbi:MAG: hypothetical protein PHH10_10385, partial [Dysgonamonadaceae bacterium]|nr:hypothetical protein [Dysgonamonadaceae bacterium]
RDLGYRTYAMLQKGTLDQRVLRERYVEALELEKAIQRAIMGGGGFVLGFTHHYKEVRDWFSEKGIEIIPVYQYETN